MITANVTQIVERASAELGLSSPEVGFGSTDQLGIQATALINSLGENLMAAHDWQNLEKVATLAGDGVNDSFAMPADFGRIVNQTLWSTSDRLPVSGPMTPQQWGWVKYGIVADDILYRYRIIDNKLVIFPAPGLGEQFKFFYISKNWVRQASSPTPNADQVVNWSDIPQFPRSIMIKGLKVLLWGQKGFDTTQLVDDYNKELAAYMAQMQGAPVINLSSTSDLFLLDARRNTPDGSW